MAVCSAQAQVFWPVYPDLRATVDAHWVQGPTLEPERVLVLNGLPAHDSVRVQFTASGPGSEMVLWTPGVEEFAHEDSRLELRWASILPFELTSVRVEVGAEYKTLDISGTPYKAGMRRAIIFAGTESLASHGFLIFEHEDRLAGRTMVAAYGFYPSDEASFSRLVTLRAVTGEVRDELGQRKWSRTRHRLVVFVNAEQFEAAERVVARWRCRGRYRLLQQDCVSMTREVAEALGLETPERGWARTRPADYIRKLIDVN